MKARIHLVLFSAAFALLTVFACSKTDSTELEEQLDQTLYSIQERGGIGKFGCFELIFPVTIQFADSTTAEVASYDELKSTVKDWLSANGTQGNGHHHHHSIIPSFVYPISVLNETGDVITVQNDDELKDLRRSCNGSFGNNGHHGHSNHLRCFDLVFPITISFPDGTTGTATDGTTLHTLVRDWKKNNPTVSGKPQFVYPITVQLKSDSSLVIVNSKDELKQLKKDCQ